jgi:GTP-binding protein LepA
VLYIEEFFREKAKAKAVQYKSTTMSNTLNLVRNFSIIAHIDHGKTTLTDAFLKETNTVSKQDFTERMMDSNPIEQERGITIKLAPVRMKHTAKDGKEYTLNLIDTPGHVDFGYEVSRSLAACEGALLLVDATQGIQAQTLSNYEKAINLGLTIIPVLNKIDLPAADPEAISLELMETFGFEEDEIVFTSAKTGLGVPELLQKIVDIIPPAEGDATKPLKALVMTSRFDQHKGAIAYVRIIDGMLTNKTKLGLVATHASFQPVEIGIFNPVMLATKELTAGDVGYVATGIKEIQQVKVGDTLTTSELRKQMDSLPGFTIPTPMVYMELYPIDADDYPLLQDAIGKLALHDAALSYAGTHSQALGNGQRVGFLGILHAEIVLERLRREFNLNLIATAPSVTYHVTLTNNQKIIIHTPADLPDPSLISRIDEPMTKATVFCPQSYIGDVMQFLRERRGELHNTSHVGTRMRLEYTLPLAEIITDMHDKLKSISSGFASLEYKLTDFSPVNAVKVSILVNREVIEALSFMAVRDDAERIGRAVVAKLKDVVPRQLFEVPIQAAIGGTVIARETVKAYRKDVTAKLYGGDVTRRQKLLKKQAKGKKRLKQFGKVELNQEAFLAVLQR